MRAVGSAGTYLMNPNGSKKTAQECEKRAREILLRGIKEADPQLSRWGDGRDADRAIAICPLDGIVNFSRRYGDFSVMAAYVEEGRPVFGAMFLPQSGEVISAEAGKGARIEGRRINASARSDLHASLTCVICDCYLYDMGQTEPMALDVIAKLSIGGVPWRNSGSAGHDFFALASGRADAVLAPALETAHAAGYIIMEEAGAAVTDWSGKPYTLRSGNIVAANPDLHGILLDFLADPTR